MFPYNTVMEFFNKKYFNEVVEQVENYFNIIEAKINNNNINNLNNDVIITNINSNEKSFVIVDGDGEIVEIEEEDDILLYSCDFINEVQFNPLMLMSFHEQQLKQLGDVIENRIYLYKNTLLNNQGTINIDDANNFIKDIFKFYYHLKNNKISYTTASISVNEYTSFKIRNIKPIDKKTDIKPKYTPNIIIDQRHEKIKESKRKYYDKNKEKFKTYAKSYYEKSKLQSLNNFL